MSARPLGASEAGRLLAPLGRFSHVALAVSGGPDSVALMHLVASWRAERGGRPEVTVLTVDHGLRPGSRDEALMVGEMARSLGLPHAILDWREGKETPTGVQAKARTARYDLMAAHCHAHGIEAIVTAHHLDDQAETFLMRLKRGSGLDGLAAIPERGSWAGIAILRPLLDVPKARLVATLADRGIGFASDPSNADPHFERARVRANAPLLAELGLTPEALALSARRLRRAQGALDATVQGFLLRHSETSEAGYATIDRVALGAAPDEIALRALSRLIAAIGGRETPARLAKLEALLDDLAEDPAKTRTLGHCRIAPIGARLGIFRETRGGGLPVVQLVPGERALWDNRFRVELAQTELEPVMVRALGETGLRDMRDRLEWLGLLPRWAARTLPACWRGEALIGVPRLGSAGGASLEAIGFRASFVHAGFRSADGRKAH